MDIRSNDIKILGRIVATTVEGVVADAEQIYDATLQESQSALNQRLANITVLKDDEYVLNPSKITFDYLTLNNVSGGENKCSIYYQGNTLQVQGGDADVDITGINKLYVDDTVYTSNIKHTPNRILAQYSNSTHKWDFQNVDSISMDGILTCGSTLNIVATDEGDSRSATLQYDYQSQNLKLDSDLVLPKVILHNDDQNYTDGVLYMSGESLIINTEESVDIIGQLRCMDEIGITNKNLTYSDEIKKDISVPAPSGFDSQHIDYTAYFGPFVPYSNIDNCIETGVYIIHTVEVSSLHQHEIPYVPAILFVQSGHNAESQHPDNTYVIQTVLQVKTDGTLYHDVRSRNYNGTWNKNFTLNNIDAPI